MTVAKRRFYVNQFSYSDYLPTVMLYDVFEKAKSKRFSNLPENMSPDMQYKGLYSYNEVLLLEIAMLVRGDGLREVSELINVPYHRLLRIVNKFDRGLVTDDSCKIEHANVYDLQQILAYIDETKPYIEKAIPQNIF